MVSLRLSNGVTIQIRQAVGEDLARIGRSVAHLKDHAPAPGDQDGQAAATTLVAETLAPFVTGADVTQLADHFTAYPRDMAPVMARVIGSNTQTPRGKPRK